MTEAKELLKSLARHQIAMGPVVGYTTHESTRIWARATSEQVELVVRWAAADGTPAFEPPRGGFAPIKIRGKVSEQKMARCSSIKGLAAIDPSFDTAQQAVLEGLEADQRYFYEVVPAGTKPAADFAMSQPLSFRTPPDDPEIEPRFAFLSCNGIHQGPSGEDAAGMWERLCRAALGDDGVHFALLGGDQVYADSIRETWLAENASNAELDKKEAKALLIELREAYRRIYRAFWARPAVRVFMAHVPCLMTWDDHDIYDGWGSQGDEGGLAQKVFFQAAAEAFEAHQMIHNPPALRPTPARIDDHRAFAFRVGAVGFLVLDLRTCRNVRSTGPSGLLGTEQWADVAATLAGWGKDDLLSIRQLVVVTSVPPLFTDRWITEMPKWLVRGGKDDLLDQWGSPPNRNDQSRLFGTLFEFRKSMPGPCNVLILGGDVHIAAAGTIRTDANRFVRDNEGSARIHQLVSSGIGYAAPSGIKGWAMQRAVEGEHALGQDFVGNVARTYLARNFSIVRAAKKDHGFRAEIHLEDEPAPRHHHFADVGA